MIPDRNNSPNLLINMMIGLLSGQSPEVVVEQALRQSSPCRGCREGWPLENGVHNALGIPVPCEVASE